MDQNATRTPPLSRAVIGLPQHTLLLPALLTEVNNLSHAPPLLTALSLFEVLQVMSLRVVKEVVKDLWEGRY